MMNSKSIELLRRIARDIDSLADSLSKETNALTPAQDIPEEVPPSELIEMEDSNAHSLEKLKAMAYNDLKKLAKEMGIDAKGNKSDLVERISFQNSVPKEEDEEEDEEEVEEEETLQDKVERELQGYSEEELADILTSIGESPKGKRQALISKIIKAVEEGKLSFDEEDEDEEVEENEEVEEKDEEKDVEEDEEGIPHILDPSTEVREKELLRVEKAIRKDYKAGKISDKEISETLEGFFTEDEDYNAKLPKADKLELYIEMYKKLIDDEGKQHDFEELYYINDLPICCGHYLSELDEEGYCEVCGTVYPYDED